jgi:hypothetical protein
VLSRSELDPCAAAAGSDIDAVLKEDLPNSPISMRCGNHDSGNPKELRAVRKVRRHVCAQHSQHPVLPIDHHNVRMRVSERLLQPTLRFQLRCGVSQISQQGGYSSSVFFARGARPCVDRPRVVILQPHQLLCIVVQPNYFLAG